MFNSRIVFSPNLDTAMQALSMKDIGIDMRFVINTQQFNFLHKIRVVCTNYLPVLVNVVN